MSVFKRIFKVTQSETHALVDKIEDPIKMTEQGIRDLKKDLQQAMTSLAEVKATAIRSMFLREPACISPLAYCRAFSVTL